MSDRELMQQALDALEYLPEMSGIEEAIQALRDRLAQPEPEPVIPAGVITAIRNAGLTLVQTQHGYHLQRIEGIKAQPELYKQPEDNRLLMKAYRAIYEKHPKPEPVAWGIANTRPTEKNPLMMVMLDEPKPSHLVVPLYTAPPKREWVGLTDEEVDAWGPLIQPIVRSIEAKLKEKNT